jgi:hypothetical protein
MSIFGYTFVTSLLHQMGWPRKAGLLRREFHDPTLVDMATKQMIHWAASLGAGRPDIALQMIAAMFSDKDWNGQDAPQIHLVIHGSRKHWDANPEADPCDIVDPVPFAKHYTRMTSDQLKQGDTHRALEQYVLESCIWGLANRDRFVTWYTNHANKHSSKMPVYERAGLGVEALPEVDTFINQSVQIVRDYEQKVGPLPAIPARLRSDVSALGIEIH